MLWPLQSRVHTTEFSLKWKSNQLILLLRPFGGSQKSFGIELNFIEKSCRFLKACGIMLFTYLLPPYPNQRPIFQPLEPTMFSVTSRTFTLTLVSRLRLYIQRLVKDPSSHASPVPYTSLLCLTYLTPSSRGTRAKLILFTVLPQTHTTPSTQQLVKTSTKYHKP